MKRIKKDIRKLIKLSGSLVVSLPIEYITALKWKEKQKVVISKLGRHLIIKDWKS